MNQKEEELTFLKQRTLSALVKRCINIMPKPYIFGISIQVCSIAPSATGLIFNTPILQLVRLYSNSIFSVQYIIYKRKFFASIADLSCSCCAVFIVKQTESCRSYHARHPRCSVRISRPYHFTLFHALPGPNKGDEIVAVVSKAEMFCDVVSCRTNPR